MHELSSLLIHCHLLNRIDIVNFIIQCKCFGSSENQIIIRGRLNDLFLISKSVYMFG